MGRLKISDLEVDDQELRAQKRDIKKTAKQLEDVVDQLVKKYSADLDEFMAEIRDIIQERDSLTDFELEKVTIKVPVFMYFAATGLENLGIEYDASKLNKSQAFSKSFAFADGTIHDKNAEAEQETMTEQFLEIAFLRAYKQLKQKLDVCENLCLSLRKIVGKRTQDIAISRYDQNGVERDSRK